MTGEPDWEEQLGALWSSIDNYEPEDFVARIQTMTSELPKDNHGIALFELAAANDSTGHSDRAVPLYEQALAAGLAGIRRRRAVIQLSSSLRNLGQSARSVDLLTVERTQGSDELDDAVVGFLALALVDTGRAAEATSLALGALARHLPRYNRSLASYAADLLIDAAA